MLTKPIRFVQIAVNSDHIFGLSEEGEVYYRDKPPYQFTSYNNNSAYGGSAGAMKKDADEEKKAWKKLFMEHRVEVPKGGPEREAQPANEPEVPVEVVVDAPARKIYKDAETVKSVQTALKEKGFYKKDGPTDTYKIDGDLGNLTVNAIKAFQKSINLQETGEIDLNLCEILGLTKQAENETIIELAPDDVVEDVNEIDGA